MSFPNSCAHEDGKFSAVEISTAHLLSSYPNMQTSLIPRSFRQGALSEKFNNSARHPQYHFASVLRVHIPFFPKQTS